MKIAYSIFTGFAVLIAATQLTRAASQIIGWGQLPAPVSANPIAVAGGDGFSLALNADGTVSHRDSGMFGPTVRPPANLNNVISIAAGDNVAIALRSDGSVRAWGDIAEPPSDVTNAVAVSAGYNFCAVLRADGTVRCWGSVREPPGLSNIVAIAAGGSLHVAALKANGNVICWGESRWGESPAVTNVPPGLSNVVAIAAGLRFTVALKKDGTVTAWGDNPFGVMNVPPSLADVIAISAGNASHVLALRRNGTVVAWGRNSHGQSDVPPGLTNVVAIATGSGHSMAIVGDVPPLLQAHLLPRWTNGHFAIQLPTQSGRVYQAESTVTLTAPNWVALPLAAGTGAFVSIPDFSDANAHRFYRVREW